MNPDPEHWTALGSPPGALGDGLGHVEFLTSPLAFRLVQTVLGV